MAKRKMIGTLFFALIAEMDLVIKNMINIFFVSHYLGAEGAAAYEVIMPCVMVASAVVALGFNGVQAICAKDYGAGDFDAFERHKHAGYTWMLMLMAALTLLLALFKGPMLDLLGANDGSAALARLSRECYSVFLLCFVSQGFFSLACCSLRRSGSCWRPTSSSTRSCSQAARWSRRPALP